jgi:hypothetical protein
MRPSALMDWVVGLFIVFLSGYCALCIAGRGGGGERSCTAQPGAAALLRHGARVI